MENPQNPPEEEVDLRDYINVIIKRKKLILAIFFVAVVASAIVSLSMPKVYEITSTVQLGSINGLLISKEEAQAIVLNQNSLQSIIKALNLNIDVESLSKNIKIKEIAGTDLLTVKIIYPNIDTAFKINNAILNPLITKGQSLYQARTAISNGRLKELYVAIKNAEEDISKTQNLIINIPSSDNISQAEVSLRMIILQNTLPKYENNLTDLRNQRNDLQILLANSKDFMIFDAPIKPKYSIAPKKKQNVLIAGVLSLIFGVFLAFFLEFWQKGKEVKAK